MRNTKIIDPSLNKKIEENERKIHNLFNGELDKSKSRRILSNRVNNSQIARNIHHKKNKSQDEIYNDSYKKNNETSNFKTIIENTPYNKNKNKTIQFDGDDSMAFINKMEKRIKYNNTSKKEEEKNNKIFYSTFNNVYQKLKNKQSKKVYNKVELNNIVDRLYNNDYKNKKQLHKDKEKEKEKDNSTIDFSIKTDSMETPIKKQNEANVNVDEMIERFKDDIKKRNENIEKKREEIKKKEKKIYKYKTEFNKKSKKYISVDKDNFLEMKKKY